MAIVKFYGNHDDLPERAVAEMLLVGIMPRAMAPAPGVTVHLGKEKLVKVGEEVTRETFFKRLHEVGVYNLAFENIPGWTKFFRIVEITDPASIKGEILKRMGERIGMYPYPFVSCADHEGPQRTIIVCKHVLKRERISFFSVDPTDDQPGTAFCMECALGDLKAAYSNKLIDVICQKHFEDIVREHNA